MPFRPLAMLAAAIMLALALILIFVPGLLFAVFGLAVGPVTAFTAKRTAMFMLGFALLFWLGRDATCGETRRLIAASAVVTLGGLALLGLFEFLRGQAGPGIFLAIATESLLALGFARHLRGPGAGG